MSVGRKKIGVEKRKSLRTQAMIALRIKIRKMKKTHQRKYGQRFRERNNDVCSGSQMKEEDGVVSIAAGCCRMLRAGHGFDLAAWKSLRGLRRKQCLGEVLRKKMKQRIFYV